jgi:hypothetical protein
VERDRLGRSSRPRTPPEPRLAFCPGSRQAVERGRVGNPTDREPCHWRLPHWRLFHAASACSAVGQSGPATAGSVTLAEMWDGTSWSIQATPNVIPAGMMLASSHLSSMSWTAATGCTAVGYWTGLQCTNGQPTRNCFSRYPPFCRSRRGTVAKLGMARPGRSKRPPTTEPRTATCPVCRSWRPRAPHRRWDPYRTAQGGLRRAAAAVWAGAFSVLAGGKPRLGSLTGMIVAI